MLFGSRIIHPADTTLPSAKLEVSGDLLPVRKLVTGRRAQPTGVFYSSKNQRSVEHESRGEKIAMLFAEMDPDVERYFPQPFKLTWYETRKMEYTPDRLDFIGGAPVVVEVKRDRRFERDPDYLRKLDTAEKILAAEAIGFKVETRADLEADVRLGAIEAIRYAAARDISSTMRRRAIEFLKLHETAELGDLEDALGGGTSARSIACALVPRRLAEFDLYRPLSSSTAVSLGKAAPK